jgi:hypothetical protein
MHGAGAAQRGATTEFGAGHAENVSQHPEQRRIGVDIDTVPGSVNTDRESHRGFSFLCGSSLHRHATIL